jgi:hypothetical protein
LFQQGAPAKNSTAQQIVQLVTKDGQQAEETTTLKSYPVKPIVLKENQSITDLLDEIFDNKTVEAAKDQGFNDEEQLPTILMEPMFETSLGETRTTSEMPSTIETNESTLFTDSVAVTSDGALTTLTTTNESVTGQTAAGTANNTLVSMVTSVFPATNAAFLGNSSDPSSGTVKPQCT